MICHFEIWWKHCFLTAQIFSFFWSQLCAKCDLDSQDVLFSFRVGFFFPHNWLFISAMCVYYPAGLLFSSFLYDLFLQSIFLASCERHLMELIADSAAWSVLHGGLVIQFGSKTHSGTFTTAVIHQLIPLWLQSKVLSVVWGIFRAVFGSRQFPLAAL